MSRIVCLLLLMLSGCGGDSVAESPVAVQQVYFDVQSKRAVVAEASTETPAVHPETGRRTLMPALYCTQCAAWRAAPPLQELQRNPQARLCPKCKGPLAADGPLPATGE
ncbi:MAG: hypothetical protein JNG89_07120 [Planctomycetaceae bacterium]|nr:hypothetical protein [Planctomycetaceae bacterium]